MTTKSSSETTNYLQSRLGMFLSVACAIHCVATPILFLVAPTIASRVEGFDWLEWAAFGLALSLTIWQIWPEYLYHRHSSALILAVSGLGLVLVGLICTYFSGLEDVHWLSAGVGSVLVAAAFYKAHRLRHHPKHETKVVVLHPEI